MKTMLSSFEGQSMIDIGTQAIAGIGRRISDNREDGLAHQLELAHDQAERHRRSTVAIMKPDQNAPAAQQDVVGELGVRAWCASAFEHRLGRRHVDEADMEARRDTW